MEERRQMEITSQEQAKLEADGKIEEAKAAIETDRQKAIKAQEERETQFEIARTQQKKIVEDEKLRLD